MSIEFDWSCLQNKQLIQQIRQSLNNAICSDKDVKEEGTVHVVELDFGSDAPDITIVKLNRLSEDVAQGSVSFRYDGDASIKVLMRVQLNCCASKGKTRAFRRRSDRHLGTLDCTHPLTAPVYVGLSSLRLEGKLVVSFRKPFLTLRLQNSALKQIFVNSSFDGSVIEDLVAHEIAVMIKHKFESLAGRRFEFDLSTFGKQDKKNENKSDSREEQQVDGIEAGNGDGGLDDRDNRDGGDDDDDDDDDGNENDADTHNER